MKTVVGVVSNHREAEMLIRELKRSGFRSEDFEIIGMRANGTEGEGYRSIEEFFGAEEAPEVRGYYAPGEVIVSVFAEDEDAERAAVAMIRRGSVRIYNHSTERLVVEELTSSSFGRSSVRPQ